MAGMCVLSCPAGQSACPPGGSPTYCADLQTSRDDCGACGTICRIDQICTTGSCGVPQPKRVFVTSLSYPGNLSGLAGADSICQMHATNATPPLSGVFKAWLSDSTASPSTRFTRSALIPYQLVDGTEVASNWADLIDGNLATAITLDENGQAPASGHAWTGTTSSGTTAVSHCADWTDTTGNVTGRVGAFTLSDFEWSEFTFAVCTVSGRLYCFEQ